MELCIQETCCHDCCTDALSVYSSLSVEDCFNGCNHYICNLTELDEIKVRSCQVGAKLSSGHIFASDLDGQHSLCDSGGRFKQLTDPDYRTLRLLQSSDPTEAPTDSPSSSPTASPSSSPMLFPSQSPIIVPTVSPTDGPTVPLPTLSPVPPTFLPTELPTPLPTPSPTILGPEDTLILSIVLSIAGLIILITAALLGLSISKLLKVRAENDARSETSKTSSAATEIKPANKNESM